MNPTVIKIDPADNVRVVANERGLQAGTEISGGIVLKDFVPQGHKVALVDIEKKWFRHSIRRNNWKRRRKNFEWRLGK